ncbi:hypothetical protein B4919_01710 [Francisella tularensis subsp. novicida]|uniref:ATP-grasp domain-containing protein n=1 Tax=Francisella tularensis TaxID=263 RepID=UPI000CE29690|nr:ATP-grasp domain-containing protein [Francisella tularensis]AVC43593.1 hypothetical protein B4919_01710 [Francisella tularensis subsp. novicida]
MEKNILLLYPMNNSNLESFMEYDFIKLYCVVDINDTYILQHEKLIYLKIDKSKGIEHAVAEIKKEYIFFESALCNDEWHYEFAAKILDRIRSIVKVRLNDINKIFYSKSDMNNFLNKKMKIIKKDMPLELKSEFLSDMFKINGTIITKPLDPKLSGGSFGVEIFKSYPKALDYVNNLNFDVIVEQLYEGKEYFIDMTTLNGEHHFIGAYEYIQNKDIKSTFIGLKNVSDASIISKLKTYVEDILTRINYINGFSHIELMVHGDTINMIEFNPRTSGVAGMANKISQKVNGITQIKKYVSILFDNKSEKNLNHFNFGYLFFIKKDILKNIKSKYDFFKIPSNDIDIPLYRDIIGLVNIYCQSGYEHVFIEDIKNIMETNYNIDDISFVIGNDFKELPK